MYFWLSIALLPAFVGSALAAVKAPVSVRFSKAAYDRKA
jgi:hypothetical protein